jgi:hypothetical protein
MDTLLNALRRFSDISCPPAERHEMNATREGVQESRSPAQWRDRLALRFENAIEAIFGPDPGLLRLHAAARTVASAALTLAVLLLLWGGQGAAPFPAPALPFGPDIIVASRL